MFCTFAGATETPGARELCSRSFYTVVTPLFSVRHCSTPNYSVSDTLPQNLHFVAVQPQATVVVSAAAVVVVVVVRSGIFRHAARYGLLLHVRGL